MIYVIIGSQVGNLPIIESFTSQNKLFACIGHSTSQTGATQSPIFFEVDYNNSDQCFQILGSLISKHQTICIIPGCHDLCFKVYAEFIDSLGSKKESESQLTERIHNKALYRKYLHDVSSDHSIRSSPLLKCNIDEFKFPIIYKPQHAGGGRGIRVINSRSEYLDLIAKQEFPDTGGIVEEYLDLDLYSVSLWLEDGEPVAFFGAREYIDNDKYRVNASATSNSLLKKFQSANIIDELASILAQLGLKDGFAHTQLLWDGKGNNWRLIETMRRIPGDLYGYAASTYGTFDYYNFYVNIFVYSPSDYPSCSDNLNIFPDDSTFFRVMTRMDEQSVIKFKPMRLFSSHGSTSDPDCYNISFYKVPSSCAPTYLSMKTLVTPKQPKN